MQLRKKKAVSHESSASYRFMNNEVQYRNKKPNGDFDIYLINTTNYEESLWLLVRDSVVFHGNRNFDFSKNKGLFLAAPQTKNTIIAKLEGNVVKKLYIKTIPKRIILKNQEYVRELPGRKSIEIIDLSDNVIGRMNDPKGNTCGAIANVAVGSDGYARLLIDVEPYVSFEDCERDIYKFLKLNCKRELLYNYGDAYWRINDAYWRIQNKRNLEKEKYDESFTRLIGSSNYKRDLLKPLADRYIKSYSDTEAADKEQHTAQTELQKHWEKVTDKGKLVETERDWMEYKPEKNIKRRYGQLKLAMEADKKRPLLYDHSLIYDYNLYYDKPESIRSDTDSVKIVELDHDDHHKTPDLSVLHHDKPESIRSDTDSVKIVELDHDDHHEAPDFSVLHHDKPESLQSDTDSFQIDTDSVKNVESDHDDYHKTPELSVLHHDKPEIILSDTDDYEDVQLSPLYSAEPRNSIYRTNYSLDDFKKQEYELALKYINEYKATETAEAAEAAEALRAAEAYNFFSIESPLHSSTSPAYISEQEERLQKFIKCQEIVDDYREKHKLNVNVQEPKAKKQMDKLIIKKLKDELKKRHRKDSDFSSKNKKKQKRNRGAFTIASSGEGTSRIQRGGVQDGIINNFVLVKREFAERRSTKLKTNTPESIKLILDNLCHDSDYRDNLMDLGSGEGWLNLFARALYSYLHHSLGVDRNIDAINRSYAHTKKLGFKKCKFVHKNILEMTSLPEMTLLHTFNLSFPPHVQIHILKLIVNTPSIRRVIFYPERSDYCTLGAFVKHYLRKQAREECPPIILQTKMADYDEINYAYMYEVNDRFRELAERFIVDCNQYYSYYLKKQ